MSAFYTTPPAAIHTSSVPSLFDEIIFSSSNLLLFACL